MATVIGSEPIETLWRRAYALTTPPDEKTEKAFLVDAIERTHEVISSITSARPGGLLEIKVIVGCKFEGSYDDGNDCLAKPPYYQWCRCTFDLPHGERRDVEAFNKIRRNNAGLLNHVDI